MDFAFTPEQDELIRTLRVFARKELASRSASWDRTGEFPRDIWRRMASWASSGCGRRPSTAAKRPTS